MSSTSTSVVPEHREWGCSCPQAVLFHASHGSSWLVLKHLKDAHTDGSCSPGYERLHVGPALLQRRPVTEPTLSYTQPTSPNRGGQTRSTWTASYTRQSDGTPVGLILGEAQPWAVCLVYASRCLKSGGQLSPSFQIRRVTSWYGRSEVKITGCTG